MNQKTKKLWQLVMLLTVDLTILIFLTSLSAERADAMCLGYTGERVAAIQYRLSELGLYGNIPCGQYDFETRRGVKYIQRQNGIEPDGETNYKTLAAMGLDSRSGLCFTAQTELLARCIQQSDCLTYPEMLEIGRYILGNVGDCEALGKYISKNYPSFYDKTVGTEPSSQAYTAAIEAIKQNETAH